MKRINPQLVSDFWSADPPQIKVPANILLYAANCFDSPGMVLTEAQIRGYLRELSRKLCGMSDEG